MKKALIINAFQLVSGISSGRLNNTIIRVIEEELKGRKIDVLHTKIEQGYDANEEVEKHIWADLVILQAPVYWFGTPWIYKKYVDEVFTLGYAQQKMLFDDGRSRENPQKQYGSGGKLQGRKYMISLTWNAPLEAFNNAEQTLFGKKSVDDIFVNNTANYKFCGFDILPSFSCFDVVKNPQIENDIARLKEHLKAVL